MARFLKQSFAQTCLKKRTMVNCINLIIEMSPRFILGRENVLCVAEVVNSSLKADCTDFTSCWYSLRAEGSLLDQTCSMQPRKSKNARELGIKEAKRILVNAKNYYAIKYNHSCAIWLVGDAPGKFVTCDSALERWLRSSPPDLEFFKRENKMKMSQQEGSNPRPQDN